MGTPFERTAVNNVSFTLEPGAFAALVGHTGSGKSTLAQHLNGLLKPTSGSVLLDGKDIWAEPKKIRQTRFRVGLVFQYPEHQLFEETVYKDIAFGPSNMGLADDEVDACVRSAADLVDLTEELLGKSPFELSGGQKRRVAIAGVLAMKPSILVLDEPTAGLDPQGRKEIMEQIRRYQQKEGASVLLISHSMEDVCQLAERVLVMRNGSLVADGTVAEVFESEEVLHGTHLVPPEITSIFNALMREGLPVGPTFAVEDGANQLLAVLRQRQRV